MTKLLQIQCFKEDDPTPPLECIILGVYKVFSVVSSPQIQPLQVLEVLVDAVEEAQQAGGIFPLE